MCFCDSDTAGSAWWKGKSTSLFGTSISAQILVPAPASQRKQIAGGSSLVNPALKIVLWIWFLAP